MAAVQTAVIGSDIMNQNMVFIESKMSGNKDKFHRQVCRQQKKHRTHMWFEVMVLDLHNVLLSNLVVESKGTRDLAGYLEATHQHELRPDVKFLYLVVDLKTGCEIDVAVREDGTTFCPSILYPSAKGSTAIVCARGAPAERKEEPAKITRYRICSLPICSKLPKKAYRCAECGATPYCDAICAAIDRPRHESVCALKCKNPACVRRETTGGQRFKKCSGCRMAVYCSPDCQYVHWRSGHQAECLVFRQQQVKFPRATDN